MKNLMMLAVLACLACGALPPTQPFIKVNVVNADGLVAPEVTFFEVTNEAIVDGSLISKEIEIPLDDVDLPTSFVLLFSEGVRGTNVDIIVRGIFAGEEVFLATATGVADADEIFAVARFCGDGGTDQDRVEACDDGESNSDTIPDACRTTCELPACGDAVIDTGEDCDDGPSNSDTTPDACRSTCEFAFCGDGVADSGEQCDDGVNNSDVLPDSCRLSCSLALCGDGVVDAGEDCDDANGSDNDGCDNDCVLTAVTQLAAGQEHTCALLRSGGVRCWGNGLSGRLGYGNEENIGDDEDPAVAGDVNVGGRVIQLAAGGEHTCALLDTGNVRCWGRSNFGQLGYGNTVTIGDNEDPIVAGDVNVGGAVVQIDAGNFHTCALLATGNVRCWGQGASGRLGYGNVQNIGDNEVPSAAGNVSVGGVAIQVAAGGSHTCALLAGDPSEIVCWGLGANGQLGYGNASNIGDDELPSSETPVFLGEPVLSISAGEVHSCKIVNTGNVGCWGEGSVGQLGYGNTNDISVVAFAVNINVGGNSIRADTGAAHTCVLLNTGDSKCWGEASSGQLGYGNALDIGNNETPSTVGVVPVGGKIAQLVVGSNHSCSLLDDGRLVCWGLGTSGQLGYGNTFNIGDNEPISVAGDVAVF